MITEKDLEERGYKYEFTFRQVGNYEDEDNLDFYVKDDIAIGQPFYHDFKEGIWRVCYKEEITYANGWPDDIAVITEPNQIP